MLGVAGYVEEERERTMNYVNKDTRPTLSYEIFPPNTEVGDEKLIAVLDDLKNLHPAFISVTCSNKHRNIEETTVKIANYVQNELHIPTKAHLPALYLSKEQVRQVIDSLDQLGIHKLLALRGDIIEGAEPKRDFSYASDVVRFVKDYAPHFEISGACYPEVHPDSPNQVQDIRYLKEKVDAGCSNLITQLFLDNRIFYEFHEKCALANIEVPIIAGVMPIINRKQALRLLNTNSTRIPKKFKAILDKYEHDPVALRDAGLAYALNQIVDLVTQGADGIHLYTMNQSHTAKYIEDAAGSLFRSSVYTDV